MYYIYQTDSQAANYDDFCTLDFDLIDHELFTYTSNKHGEFSRTTDNSYILVRYVICIHWWTFELWTFELYFRIQMYVFNLF